MRRARANDSKASRLGGRSDRRRYRRFDRFDLKPGDSVTSCDDMREGLTGLASKPGETGLTGLGLKTESGLDAVKVRAEGTWRHREAYVVKAVCPSVAHTKSWTNLLLHGLLKKTWRIRKGWAAIQFGRSVLVALFFSLSVSLFFLRSSSPGLEIEMKF